MHQHGNESKIMRSDHRLKLRLGVAIGSGESGPVGIVNRPLPHASQSSLMIGLTGYAR